MATLIRAEKLFFQLILFLEKESMSNEKVIEFYNYCKQFEKEFTVNNNNSKANQLKEIIRGLNKYSDEFVFSETNNSKIKSIMNEIFILLNEDI